jgi:hypothetical protein
MMTWLASWLVNPWLFVAGGALVAVPVIIHLLNRRRFKIVDWAAMDFLIDADKRNRRRVRLENLVLLLLRCLAVLLLGLLVARPFLPTAALSAAFLDSVRYERIVLFDDSLSMQTGAVNRSALDDARRALADFVRELATNATDDSLTLVLTSRPDQPIFHGRHVDAGSLGQIVRQVESLEGSDRTADLERALVSLEKLLAGPSDRVNRVLYVLTDLRRRDWHTAAESGEASEGAEEVGPASTEPANESAAHLLRRLSERLSGVDVVEFGAQRTGNVLVAEILPQDKVLVAGVSTRFDVAVRNAGAEDALGVRVRFTAGDSPPLEATIDRLAAGETKQLPFTFTFARREETDEAGQAPRPPESIPVTVELLPLAVPGFDELAGDNSRYFAARVSRGVPCLLVDGDPSAEYGRSESFYLRRALAPPGRILSGIAVDTATETEWESRPLERYQVIVLCNVYGVDMLRSGGEMAHRLEEWVHAGGGLVVALGDQVDEKIFNENLFREGRGLSPVRLDGLRGDESNERWVHLRAGSAAHPVFSLFAGQDNPFAEHVKIFRWWRAVVNEEESRAGRAAVSVRYSDGEQSPAVIERTHGAGRVMVLAAPLDADWSDWPADPSYIVAMQELVRYMARKSAGEGTILVGQPIRHSVDLTMYRPEVTLAVPDGPVQSIPAAPADAASPSGQSLWWAEHAATDRRGFYELGFTRRDGTNDRLLVAVNPDASEGELARADEAALRRLWQGSAVRLVRGGGTLARAASGARQEVWPYFLALAGTVLGLEQLLGWWFGRGRK